MKSILATLTLTLSLAAINSFAQDAPTPPTGPRPPGAPGGDGQRPPVPGIIAALDTNHDGVIDATEIANAPAALRTLDKNGDGKLTMDELRPPRAGGNRAGAGPNGPGAPADGDHPPQRQPRPRPTGE